MSNTIPASDIVTVTPGVLPAGGRALDLVAIMLSTAARVPFSAGGNPTVKSFANATDVGAYFGASSDEAAAATIYFNGFKNAHSRPAKVYFAQYPTAKVGAVLRGGSIAAMTLAQLQAVAGDIDLTIDGFEYDVTGLNFSAATSFSNAAATIQTALRALNPTAGSITASTAGATLTVTVVGSGQVAPGQQLGGVGVLANTFITAQLTGTPHGVGTYSISRTQTISSEAMTTSMVGGGPTVTYDSVQGGLVFASQNIGAASTITFATGTAATSLKLLSTSGGYLSQGADAASPGTYMDAIVNITQDWATFMTVFDPDSGANTNKVAFAVWANGKNNRYAYVPWDTDVNATAAYPQATTLGNILKANAYSGTCPIYCPNYSKAAFICGTAAAIDFTQFNGRITFKFRAQDGLTPDVTSQSVAQNLRDNGYNFYGVWATANDQFISLADGTVSGEFVWMDSYVNQIWMNSQFQLALMVLLFNVYSIPYDDGGYALIRAACQDTINQALNFGAIRTGVALSAAQAQEVNAAAGVVIDGVLQDTGYYLQILDADPQTRAARSSPPMTFWYMDGGSVHKINLASIMVQ